MSIKVMTNVWDLSQHEGSTLLLLLALADHASDDGVCWPGIARLATKTRKKARHVKRLLRQLEDSGELYVHPGGKGPGDTNLYFIPLGLDEEEIRATLVERFEVESELALQITQEIMVKISSRVAKGDTQDTLKGDTQDILTTAEGDTQDILTTAKGDTQDILKDDAQDTLPGERVTSRAKRVTSRADKGDAHVTRTIKNHQKHHSDVGVQQQEHQHIITLLADFGISRKVAEELAGHCTLAQIEGWIDLAQRSNSVRDPPAFVVSKLQAGECPPSGEKSRGESSEARHRRYLGGKYGHLVQH